jgi:hypothetical protein
MLRIFDLLWQADDLLTHSWQDRKWATFIRVWLTAAVAVTVVAFIVPMLFMYVPGSLYNVFAAIVGAKRFGISFPDILWNIATPFSALVGAFTLFFTVPAMVLKQLSGDLAPR